MCQLCQFNGICKIIIYFMYIILLDWIITLASSRTAVPLVDRVTDCIFIDINGLSSKTGLVVGAERGRQQQRAQKQSKDEEPVVKQPADEGDTGCHER